MLTIWNWMLLNGNIWNILLSCNNKRNCLKIVKKDVCNQKYHKTPFHLHKNCKTHSKIYIFNSWINLRYNNNFFALFSDVLGGNPIFPNNWRFDCITYFHSAAVAKFQFRRWISNEYRRWAAGASLHSPNWQLLSGVCWGGLRLPAKGSHATKRWLKLYWNRFFNILLWNYFIFFSGNFF